MKKIVSIVWLVAYVCSFAVGGFVIPARADAAAPCDTLSGFTRPLYASVIGNKMYITNDAADSVSVINTATNAVSTISVPEGARYSTIVGTKLYVADTFTSYISIIDTVTDTLIDDFPSGATGPYALVGVGNKVYVLNQASENIKVVNTLTGSIIATIATTDTPSSSAYAMVVVGQKLYATNGTTVDVIDTTTDTITSTITVGSGAYALAVVGDKIYVGNYSSNNVSVISTVTDTVVATISTGHAPNQVFVSGTKVYFLNDVEAENTISVIDSTSDTLATTISLGGDIASYANLVGTTLYVVTNNEADGPHELVTINTLTDAVTGSIVVGDFPTYIANSGRKLYVLNYNSNDVSVINPSTNTIVNTCAPVLTSFTSTTSNGTYTSGQTINITANFNEALGAGSTMTVTLNTGATVILSTVSGATLSGSYMIASGETTPDLSVSSIVSASISDTTAHSSTNYNIPFSVGSFTAENSEVARDIGDSKNIVIGSYLNIPVGNNPYQISSPITVSSVRYVYVANQGDDSVSVIRLSDNSVVATVGVGDEPYGLTTATVSGTTYVYVANIGSNTVSVINTATNTVAASISVGVKPYYAATIGTNIYVTNAQSNTVSVINGATNTVTATIPVGVYPRGIKAYGTDLYVANYGDLNYGGGNTVSVINSLTNMVSATIVLPVGSIGPRGVVVSGTKVYVSNYISNNVSVINTATNAVTATVAVGAGPRGMAALGTNVYVQNFDDGTISVIGTTGNTVTDTVAVGHSPAGMGVVDTDIYLSRFQDNAVSVLDTTTNDLREAVATTFTLTGPSSGNVNEASTNFTVTPNGTYTGTITITPSGGGLSTPIVLTFSSSAAQTFTITPTAAGTVTLTPTNDGSLSNPSSLTYTVAAASASIASSGGGSVGRKGSSFTSLPVTIPSSNPTLPDMPLLTKTLRYPMRDPQVLLLQKFLNQKGFPVSASGKTGIDGIFGTMTKKAVVKFQASRGLKSDGIVGPITRMVINALALK